MCIEPISTFPILDEVRNSWARYDRPFTNLSSLLSFLPETTDLTEVFHSLSLTDLMFSEACCFLSWFLVTVLKMMQCRNFYSKSLFKWGKVVRLPDFKVWLHCSLAVWSYAAVCYMRIIASTLQEVKVSNSCKTLILPIT